MEKKAQVTLYVIIGLVVLLLVGTLFYSNARIKKTQLTEEAPLAEFSEQAVKEIMDDCLKDLTLEAMDEHGLCHTELLFQEKMMQMLPVCINLARFENQDYEVRAKSKPDKAQVTITEDEIFVKVKYPIELSKNDITYEFSLLEYSLPRRKSLLLDLDTGLMTTKDHVLVSQDLDLELSIPKGTKVTSNNEPVEEIVVYLKEVCPDDPAVLGQVKYDFEKDYEFEPEVFLTIRYEDQHVSRLAAEQQFKLAYLDGNYWKNIASSGNIEKNKVRASISHLSEWIATCDGSNKYGLELTSAEQLINAPDQGLLLTESELTCGDTFSGPCGYAKLEVFTREDGFLETYTEAINKIYDQHLIPVLVLKENIQNKQTVDGIWFTKHAGVCEPELSCIYGENEDGTDKPGYDYGTLAKFITLLDNVHADKPQWPIYVEVWEEPNLAIEWGDISLTDYQVQQYKNYYKQVAMAIKELDHAESIRLMPAGLAPTNGMKRCMLTPEYDKIYHESPETDPITETMDDGAYLMHGDCQKLRFEPEYGDDCEPSVPSDIVYKNCDEAGCQSNGYPPNDPLYDSCAYHDPVDAVETCCNNQKQKIQQAINWKNKYINYGMSNLFATNSDKYDPDPDSCLEEDVTKANAIYQRIVDTVKEYCWEKTTEIATDEFLGKLYTSDVCELMDFYADHSYPAADSLDTYPGGSSPFGMQAYKERFNAVRNKCAGSEVAAQECYASDEGDKDSDGVKDIQDNCPDNSNPDQEDWDKDGLGDVCDHSDSDDVADSVDLCPLDETIQTGMDGDGDGWADECDNCANVANRDQKDLNGNLVGDVCEENIDSDGIPETAEGIPFPLKCVKNNQQEILINCYDNCPYIPNGPNQGSCSNDPSTTCNSNLQCGVGNSCNMKQEDQDGDGFGDVCDNCAEILNNAQADWNNDGEGDKCDDTDGDGFMDDIDFCKTEYSTENTPDVCKSEALCIGKAFITKTAWAPHPDIYPFWAYEHESFNVDDYVAQMDTAYTNFISDLNLIGVIPSHMGDETVVPERLADYSWAEICTSGDTGCVGTNMYNTIGQVSQAVTTCEGGGSILTGECTDHVIRWQSIGAVLGPCRILVTCVPCDGGELGDVPSGTESWSIPPGYGKCDTVKYEYQNIHQCYELQMDLPDLHPDGDNTVSEGFNPAIIDIQGEEYVVLTLPYPASTTESNALVHVCGTAAQCDYNIGNCIEFSGHNGDMTASCIPVGDVEIPVLCDPDCVSPMVCEEGTCVLKETVCDDSLDDDNDGDADCDDLDCAEDLACAT